METQNEARTEAARAGLSASVSKRDAKESQILLIKKVVDCAGTTNFVFRVVFTRVGDALDAAQIRRAWRPSMVIKTVDGPLPVVQTVRRRSCTNIFQASQSIGIPSSCKGLPLGDKSLVPAWVTSTSRLICFGCDHVSSYCHERATTTRWRNGRRIQRAPMKPYHVHLLPHALTTSLTRQFSSLSELCGFPLCRRVRVTLRE